MTGKGDGGGHGKIFNEVMLYMTPKLPAENSRKVPGKTPATDGLHRSTEKVVAPLLCCSPATNMNFASLSSRDGWSIHPIKWQHGTLHSLPVVHRSVRFSPFLHLSSLSALVEVIWALDCF